VDGCWLLPDLTLPLPRFYCWLDANVLGCYSGAYSPIGMASRPLALTTNGTYDWEVIYISAISHIVIENAYLHGKEGYKCVQISIHLLYPQWGIRILRYCKYGRLFVTIGFGMMPHLTTLPRSSLRVIQRRPEEIGHCNIRTCSVPCETRGWGRMGGLTIER
jgi:hypothetical protein